MVLVVCNVEDFMCNGELIVVEKHSEAGRRHFVQIYIDWAGNQFIKYTICFVIISPSRGHQIGLL